MSKKRGIHSQNLVKIAVVAAVYVVFTVTVAPVSFGIVQFRISEILNFLGLHNPRYIVAVTLGVVIANIFNPASYGVADMAIGSISTFVFLWVSRWIGNRLVAIFKSKLQGAITPRMVQYATLCVVFSLSMITIAWMICHFENIWPLFWGVYASLIASEFVVLCLGALMMYPISKRVDFDE